MHMTPSSFANKRIGIQANGLHINSERIGFFTFIDKKLHGNSGPVIFPWGPLRIEKSLVAVETVAADPQTSDYMSSRRFVLVPNVVAVVTRQP